MPGGLTLLKVTVIAHGTESGNLFLSSAPQLVDESGMNGGKSFSSVGGGEFPIIPCLPLLLTQQLQVGQQHEIC